MDAEPAQTSGEVPDDKLRPGRTKFNVPWDELRRILGGPPKGGRPSTGLFGRLENMPGEDGLGFVFRKGRRGFFENFLWAMGWDSRWYQWCSGKWRQGTKGQPYKEDVHLQVRFTTELRDFLLGTLKEQHFVSPAGYGTRSVKKQERRATALSIYNYLHEKDPDGLTNAVDWLAEYQTYLVGIAAQRAQTPSIGTAAPVRRSSLVTLSASGTLAFSAKQSDSLDPQTQAILKCLQATRDTDDKQRTPWITNFDFELPTHVRGPAILSQKLALYGAYPPIDVALAPLDFATLRLTFDRSDAARIATEIADSTDKFSSHTIWSRRGQGKSIALAQVILRLADTPGCWTFWSFDKCCPTTHDVTYRYIDDLITLFVGATFVPRKIIFVVDDLHLRPSTDLIFSLHRLAHRHGNTNDVSFSFLFSAAEEEQSFSERQNTIRLRLEVEDENRLYEVMTAPEPTIVGKEYASFGELLAAAHPGKNLWKDDVQSLTDFIRRHSRPLRNFRPNWITDLDQEPSVVRQVLPLVAVAQLVDLAVPDRLLDSFAGIEKEVGYDKRTEFQKSRRLSHDGGSSEDDADTWAGYVLASSYYARSFLRNLKMLEPPFIDETLSSIVERSLDCAERDFPLWNATEAEFVRHIFQRTAKRKFGHLLDIPGTANIATRLFDRHGARISRIIKGRKAAIDCARWAGAFSYLLPKGASGHLPSELSSLKHTIYDLCHYAMKEGDGASNAKGFVPLMWAVRALFEAGSTEDDLAALTGLAENLNPRVPLESAISKRLIGWERRANQVILSYVKLLSALPGHHKKSLISDIYDEAERQYGNHFQFDAENWLTRANAVRISDGQHLGVKRRAEYLLRARQAVRSQQREQAQWKTRVERSIKTFEANHGPVSTYTRRKSPNEETE